MEPQQATPTIRIHHRLARFICQLNLYMEKNDLSETDQRLSTRVYLILLFAGLFILVCFTSIIPQAHIITITNPSVADFDHFVRRYAHTPNCRCFHATIVHRDFVSFRQRFHPVCSSDFISQEWISFLFHSRVDHFYPLDFRLSASAQFQALALLCRHAQQAVKAELDQFLSSVFISSRALSRTNLIEQLTTVLKQFKIQTIEHFSSEHRFLWTTIDQYQFISALRTNFVTKSIPGSGIYETFALIYPTVTNLSHSSQEMNGTCRCDESSHCIYPAAIYNGSNVLVPDQVLKLDASILFIIPGFYVGCLPLTSILQSTLECFYNQSCVNMVIAYSSNQTTKSFLPINASSSCHHPNETINSLFDQMMLASWNDTIDYDAYFKICAPKSCTYSVIENFVFVYVITMLISIFGGLNVTIRMLSPVVVQYRFRRYIRTEQTTIPNLTDISTSQ